MEITEALAIELTKNCLKNGQDEKPKFWHWNDDFATVKLSDGRVKVFNRVEVEHAKLMLKNKGEKNEG